MEKEKTRQNAYPFLLIIGAILAMNLKPDDFLDSELKKIETVLPKKIAESEIILSTICTLFPILLEEMIRLYIDKRFADPKKTDKEVKESLEFFFKTIQKTMSEITPSNSDSMRIGDFIVPIKKENTIQ